MTSSSKKQKAATFDASRHHVSAFATPVFAHAWPDSEEINRSLEELILHREQGSAGVSRSNVRGWHSPSDFFGWDHPSVEALTQKIQAMTRSITGWVALDGENETRSINYRLEGWANVSRDGGYNSVHNHPHSLWSGVYYVTTGQLEGDWPENGRLELLDPRAGANMLFMRGSRLEERYLIDPSPGLMVIFPGWLRHYVHPFSGSGHRISVAFNLIATEAPTQGGAH